MKGKGDKPLSIIIALGGGVGHHDDDAPPGYHYMPDGTLMADDEMEEDTPKYASGTRAKRYAGGTKKPPLGSGKRFKTLSKQLARKGAKDPDALAAHIGRKKYGKKRFSELAKKGRS